MHKGLQRISFLVLAGYLLLCPQAAQAFMPPDFVFSIATQVMQVFSVVLISLSAIAGATVQFLRARAITFHLSKLKIALIALFLIALSALGTYLYALYKQQVEYGQWLTESNKYGSGSKTSLRTADGSAMIIDTESLNGLGVVGDAVTSSDTNDRLKLDGDVAVDTSSASFVSSIAANDDVTATISIYYQNIAEHRYEEAYSVSKKSVDFATFKSWYAKTTKITLDKLVRIDEKRSSLELTLYEGNHFTRYGVLMTISTDERPILTIEDSQVKVLGEGTITIGQSSAKAAAPEADSAYFDHNQDASTVISNQDFQSAMNGSSSYFVLDARENIEYENGYFPGSTHIRFADIKAGRWIELPKDKPIYVICWSGIRGKEVAEYLRTKKILAMYLEKGASGWVEFGGQWTGNIKFVERYTDAKFQRVFTTEETKAKVGSGVFLVDTREPVRFAQGHITGSVNIPILYTASQNIDMAFSQVPPGSQVITVCDGYVNCFDAKITGVELERRGHTFLGRYNKPWEYGQ